ncbi:keratin, type I cytoskeletal 9-like [Cucumis melo var. makuwa]|uniref:Keratin, type I cytoskeletal 9-like n=1 Tax=Cucumis melo var. makuwa TaxID=1194695 RepID=A0A5A7SIJ0_CUCMM|nr:keratin, type I cytoskeletal 9-like [Cucumis melo var. makuwa]TYK04727.1 keratin, type I cytoskeletal 9-like [Cucumis melo var. makuwa]
MKKRCGSSSRDCRRWLGCGCSHGCDRGTKPQNCAGGTSNTDNGTRDKSHIKCFTCNKMKHYTTECHEKGRDDGAHLTRATDKEPALMIGTCIGRDRVGGVLLSKEQLLPKIYYNNKNEENKGVWYLNNGASNHMTNHHEKLQELDGSVTGRVKFLNESTIQIMGKGMIVFEYQNSDQKAFQEVYYIP